MRPPETLDLSCAAIFLDFDGTLADIAPVPELARIRTETLATLDSIRSAAGGAVAIVSGRPINQIDDLLAPLVMPVAGIHGAVLRTADGIVHDAGLNVGAFTDLAERAERAVRGETGIHIERKSSALAIHYRGAPETGAFCHALARSLAESVPGVGCQLGKMVVEIVPAEVDKGRAIKALLGDPPFAGRLPIFAGDDLTDEHGFTAVQELGGIAIKIGDGPSSARYRLASPSDLHGWLRGLLQDQPA